jgi:membrane associated rhomboid family serine protease
MALMSLFFYRYQKLFFLRDRRIGFVIALWGFYTIVAGFLTPQVDNFAHLGGAIGGGVALGFYRPKVLRKRARFKCG